MKLLLDENLPHRLRHELVGHDCFTVTFMNWSGIENGELLALAAEAEFDAFITKDVNLRYQQNLSDLPVAVVVLHAESNRLEAIRPLVPRLLTALNSLAPRRVTEVSAE